MTALPYLKLLELSTMGLCSIPVSVASKLKRLVHLDLSSNSFTRLPSAVSKITSLQALDLSHNNDLQLVKGDENALSALPSLAVLVLKKENWDEHYQWSAERVREIIIICKRLPQLDVRA